jgi:quinol-cytochrome oxidoreductase complex cytochrome b subunit
MSGIIGEQTMFMAIFGTVCLVIMILTMILGFCLLFSDEFGVGIGVLLMIQSALPFIITAVIHYYNLIKMGVQ